MPRITDAILDLKRLDLLSYDDSPVHRLDPRAKVVTTLAFIFLLVSFGRYEVSRLLPFALFPAAIAAVAGIPFGFLFRKAAVALPFAVAVTIFNPLLDPAPAAVVGPLVVSGGWLSVCSVIVRSLLAVSAALALVAVTGFRGVCAGLERLGMPKPFVVQLLFLYRYIFVLAEEGGRMARARELRSSASRGMGIRSYGTMLAHLLLRTWGRAERVHLAMLSRGFRGDFPLRRDCRFGVRDLLFVLGWCGAFFLFRFSDVTRFIGSVVTGAMR